MLAYGYKKDGNEETPQQLKETTLLCDRKELDSLIEFLIHFLNSLPKGKIENNVHEHYRDWDSTWTEDQADFIVVIEDE